MLYNEEIIPLVLMILDSILAICANDNAAHNSLNIHFINTAVIGSDQSLVQLFNIQNCAEVMQSNDVKQRCLSKRIKASAYKMLL